MGGGTLFTIGRGVVLLQVSDLVLLQGGDIVLLQVGGFVSLRGGKLVLLQGVSLFYDKGQACLLQVGKLRSVPFYAPCITCAACAPIIFLVGS